MVERIAQKIRHRICETEVLSASGNAPCGCRKKAAARPDNLHSNWRLAVVEIDREVVGRERGYIGLNALPSSNLHPLGRVWPPHKDQSPVCWRGLVSIVVWM